MKETFREFITVIGSDKRVVLIMGDCGEGMCKDFALKNPDRFLNVGVCEQSMVGIAAGLALEGMIPYVITITPFLIERAFEQIKMDVDYMQANVKLIGYAHLRQAGLSHKCLDEHKLMSCFRNINCFYPKDAKEAIVYFRVSYESNKPAYISIR